MPGAEELASARLTPVVDCDRAVTDLKTTSLCIPKHMHAGAIKDRPILVFAILATYPHSWTDYHYWKSEPLNDPPRRDGTGRESDGIRCAWLSLCMYKQEVSHCLSRNLRVPVLGDLKHTQMCIESTAKVLNSSVGRDL